MISSRDVYNNVNLLSCDFGQSVIAALLETKKTHFICGARSNLFDKRHVDNR